MKNLSKTDKERISLAKKIGYSMFTYPPGVIFAVGFGMSVRRRLPSIEDLQKEKLLFDSADTTQPTGGN